MISCNSFKNSFLLLQSLLGSSFVFEIDSQNYCQISQSIITFLTCNDTYSCIFRFGLLKIYAWYYQTAFDSFQLEAVDRMGVF